MGNKHMSNNRRDHKYTEKGKCFTQTAVTIQIAQIFIHLFETRYVPEQEKIKH